tara:strand:+ start:8048 stop:8659 length:612 start_codon:yes stop_codon:yes gene_type:complete
METKMIIFDLDGVLVDACEWHRVSLNESLKQISNYEISMDEHISTFNGIPTRKKLKILSERGLIQAALEDQIYQLKQHKTLEIIKRDAIIREEKIDLIKELRNKNIKVACFTNSIRETATLMLRMTGIIDLFDVIITNQDVQEPKPSPEGYNKIFNMYNFDKNEIIIIEDSPKGIQAAKSSGCRVIQVNNPDEVNLDLLKDYI